MSCRSVGGRRLWRGGLSLLGRSTPRIGTTLRYTPREKIAVRNYPGANLKELKTRIDTIHTIVKVTSSMKMIASSKLNKQQGRLEESKAWLKSSQVFMEDRYPQLDTADEFYLDKVELEQKEEVDNELIVCITSDRGLCGAVNSNVGREMRLVLPIKEKADIVCVGDKSTQQLQRDFGDRIVLAFTEVGGNKPVTFHDTLFMAESIMEREFDKISFVYSKFNSVIQYEVATVRWPGLDKILTEENRQQPYVTDPDHEVMLKSSYEYGLAALLFGIITETQTCEIAGRMAAMDNATTNGNELGKELTMQYNKERQAAITTELVEIVSGATATDELRKMQKEG